VITLKYKPEYLDDLLVRMAHHSTAIEGNTLTQGETKSILLDNYIPRSMDMRELNEVLNYKTFIRFFMDNLEAGTHLTVDFICQVHAILCKDAIQGVPGQFKKTPNIILGADFTPVPPYMVPSALTDWLLNLDAQLAAAKNRHDTVEAICRQHIAFERIHPFSDGNGRVGRALMAYSSVQSSPPPVVIPAQRPDSLCA